MPAPCATLFCLAWFLMVQFKLIMGGGGDMLNTGTFKYTCVNTHWVILVI